MERINILIDKLYQQKQAAASPAHLLFTIQLLQQELSQLQHTKGATGSQKVCITMPRNFNFQVDALTIPATGAIPKFDAAAEAREVFVLDMAPEEELVQEPEAKEYRYSKPLFQESLFETLPVVKETAKPQYTPFYVNAALDTATEVPTLTQYSGREINQLVTDKKDSLNDRLKADKTEVAHKLKEAPIKDLRKAIGINDRFVFLNQLFRGDEAAYERSIKTINGFNIYSEAEYWMARELRLKLAWSDSNEIAQQFYELVRRRFS